ncbi:hypothetical protein [Spiroplasma endosymbiont of Stenodema calcarata]|uniref:hypothetical protein n=1 Tax=Spiroplasma endosymbiont of Stenodema calcarata TaxID=3139328 RepID=UPI003CCB3656
MENIKKVIDYWDDYDPNDFDPAKRPTSIAKNNENSVQFERNIVNNIEPTTDSYSDNNDNYDELVLDDVFDTLQKPAEINQSEELSDLDELNLNNVNRFAPVEDNDQIEPVFDVNQIYDRWQKSKNNLISRKLDVIRNHVQEPRVEGRPKYSFLVPDTLEEFLKKPATVVLDTSPRSGGDELYSEKKYFNNTNLFLKVKGDVTEEPHINNLLNVKNQQIEDLPHQNPAMSDILNNAKKNIALSKEEAFFIKEDEMLDPNHLSYEQRLRLLKLAADPNNAERKILLQMKLNNGSLSSLSQIVEERVQKINKGEIELIEEITEK